MAAEAAVEAVKGEVYWREREWRMAKARRKRVLTAEEKAAAEARQAARENGAAGEKEVRKFSTVRLGHGKESTRGGWRLRRGFE